MGLMRVTHETLPEWHSTKKWCSSVSKNIYILKDFKCMWESVMMVISITVRAMMEVVAVVVQMMEAVLGMVVVREVVGRVVGMGRRHNINASMNYMVTCVNACVSTCFGIG